MNKKVSVLDRFLTVVERVGNALPAPAFMFAILALVVLLISLVGNTMGWGGVNPSSGEVIEVRNLLSREGIHNILVTLTTNFTGFAPLGVVFVSILGVGLAEGSGLIRAGIVSILSRIGGSSVTFMVVMTGIVSNMASDIGYILVIPIGGVIFHSLGRNPIAGMAAAFAGVSGGYSANLLISSTDVLLSGISTTAAAIVDPEYVVEPLANYYFMFASTIVISFVGTLINDKIVEPRLGAYTGDVAVEPITALTAVEKRGLKAAGLVIFVWVALISWGLIPEDGFMRDIQSNSVLKSVVFRGFVSLLFMISASCGLAYGFVTKKYTKAKDVLDNLYRSISDMTPYFVLVFFASQFVSWFNSSNLGLVLAIKGVELIQTLNVGLIPMVLMTIFFSAAINLVVGSASAKWLLLAPILVPMFMMLGYSPELAQCAYRIGDSSTNIITPLMSYFPLIIIYFQKYKPDAGLGTIISATLPYSIAFLIAWSLFVIVWLFIGIPLGPNAHLLLQ